MSHYDLSQIADLRRQRLAADQQLFALVFDIAAAGDGVVALEGIEHLLHRQFER